MMLHAPTNSSVINRLKESYLSRWDVYPERQMLAGLNVVILFMWEGSFGGSLLFKHNVLNDFGIFSTSSLFFTSFRVSHVIYTAFKLDLNRNHSKSRERSRDAAIKWLKWRHWHLEQEEAWLRMVKTIFFKHSLTFFMTVDKAFVSCCHSQWRASTATDSKNSEWSPSGGPFLYEFVIKAAAVRCNTRRDKSLLKQKCQ